MSLNQESSKRNLKFYFYPESGKTKNKNKPQNFLQIKITKSKIGAQNPISMFSSRLDILDQFLQILDLGSHSRNFGFQFGISSFERFTLDVELFTFSALLLTVFGCSLAIEFLLALDKRFWDLGLRALFLRLGCLADGVMGFSYRRLKKFDHFNTTRVYFTLTAGGETENLSI